QVGRKGPGTYMISCDSPRIARYHICPLPCIALEGEAGAAVGGHEVRDVADVDADPAVEAHAAQRVEDAGPVDRAVADRVVRVRAAVVVRRVDVLDRLPQFHDGERQELLLAVLVTRV